PLTWTSTRSLHDALPISAASLAADGSSPLAYWTEWCSFHWCSYPWPSRGFFLIFCWRLRFSTRRSALALGYFSVDRIALDCTRPDRKSTRLNSSHRTISY